MIIFFSEILEECTVLAYIRNYTTTLRQPAKEVKNSPTSDLTNDVLNVVLPRSTSSPLMHSGQMLGITARAAQVRLRLSLVCISYWR